MKSCQTVNIITHLRRCALAMTGSAAAIPHKHMRLASLKGRRARSIRAFREWTRQICVGSSRHTQLIIFLNK